MPVSGCACPQKYWKLAFSSSSRNASSALEKGALAGAAADFVVRFCNAAGSARAPKCANGAQAPALAICFNNSRRDILPFPVYIWFIRIIINAFGMEETPMKRSERLASNRLARLSEQRGRQRTVSTLILSLQAS